MNCRLKKVITIMGIISCVFLMTGCGQKPEDSIEKAEACIKQKDFNSAQNIVMAALEKHPDDEKLNEFKDEISLYLDIRKAYNNGNLEEAKTGAEEMKSDLEGSVFEEPLNELSERIENKEKSSSKKDTEEKTEYLKDAKIISDKEADYSIDTAFGVFTPYEEVSSNEDEFNSLMAIKERSEEQEKRLLEIKETILGASTISESVYADSRGIFRLGNQHYLYSSSGQRIIYKVYKNGVVEKVEG